MDVVYGQLMALQNELPVHHRSVLEVILNHLAAVITHESFNKMGTKNLALIFGPCLARPPSEDIK